MKENRLSFESENLFIDYISFNVQNPFDPEPLAKYCFKKFGFNSTLEADGLKETLFDKKKNQYRIRFWRLHYDPAKKQFWDGTQIIFAGQNGAYLYSLIKNNKFDWKYLTVESATIGRLDLTFFRPSEESHTKKMEDFLHKSRDKVNSDGTRRKATCDSKGLILRVGSRASQNYFRVYQKYKTIKKTVYSETMDGLQFELEMKKKVVKSVQHLLFNNQLDEFEDKLTIHFFQQSKVNFILDSCFTDWLSKYLRRIRDTTEIYPALVGEYLVRSGRFSFADQKWFFQFHQFLTFIKGFKAVEESVNGQVYFVITFRVRDFISFKKGNPNLTDHREKTLFFLRSLQKLPPLIQTFSDLEFRSSLMFPVVNLRKEKRSWILSIAVGEEFYKHTFPFIFSDSFSYYSNRIDLLVKTELMHTLGTNSLKKEFPIEDFFDQLPNIRNQKKTEAKKLIIKLLNELVESKLIKPDFEIVFKKDSKKNQTVSSLTTSLINQSRLIILFEII